MQRDRPVAFGLPAMEDVTAEGEGPFASNVFLWLDDARGQTCERGHNLESRARRIKPCRGAIVEWMINASHQSRPSLRIGLEGELVGIEARVRDHNQHAASGNIDRN